MDPEYPDALDDPYASLHFQSAVRQQSRSRLGLLQHRRTPRLRPQSTGGAHRPEGPPCLDRVAVGSGWRACWHRERDRACPAAGPQVSQGAPGSIGRDMAAVLFGGVTACATAAARRRAEALVGSADLTHALLDP